MADCLFVDNLAPETTADELQELFKEHSLPLLSLPRMRRRFAFVKCEDNQAALRALRLLSGRVELHGKTLWFEHSVPRGKR
uniref:RRM domain-containing protein n=1 Tax=Eptatretus burgeri TaxID=7764 RepID=A0A8C4QC62_EPTBU